MREWISVEEGLPSYKDGAVLVYTRYGVLIGRTMKNGRWKGGSAVNNDITHWMPLPEGPKETTKEKRYGPMD